MVVLKDILYKVTLQKVVGNTDVAIQNLVFDSKAISLNDVFFALKGHSVDGHLYIEDAINKGALVVVCETLPENIINGITYIVTENSKQALAVMAANYYGNPSNNLKLIGITGTNGKTTISSLLYKLFKSAGYKVGLLSTLKVIVDEIEYDATHTTPDSVSINYYLNEMIAQGVEYCFMEVSSHGIHQKRTHGLNFKGGIFTNLTHDHLDYHDSFSEYRDVKKSFFDNLPKTAFALVNADDKNGSVMLQNTRALKKTYALKSYADYQSVILENGFDGLLLKIDSNEVFVKLIGGFNAYNLLAIYAVADLLGLEQIETLSIMSQLENVDGRFQNFISDKKITTIIDYAHTPDALKNVLETINTIRSGTETLITVVGCGGDRDKTKRPKMGKIASTLSSKVIFTSDNPRTENPEKIIEDIEKGVEPHHYNRTLSVTNRKQAIKTACQMAKTNDIILIAGKGHETYQEVNGERFDFDDFKIVKEILKKLNK